MIRSDLSDDAKRVVRPGPDRRGQCGRVLRRPARTAGWRRRGPAARGAAGRGDRCAVAAIAGRAVRHDLRAARQRPTGRAIWRGRWRSSSNCPRPGARRRCRSAKCRRWPWNCCSRSRWNMASRRPCSTARCTRVTCEAREVGRCRLTERGPYAHRGTPGRAAHG